MWIPKDERRLLAGYFTQIGDIGTEEAFRACDLRGLLKFRGYRKRIPVYGDLVTGPESPSDVESMKREIAAYISAVGRIHAANRLLAERGLITVTRHEHERDVVVIALTLNGYDLGRRYSRFLEWSGLCFQEYRNHWVWLIVAFLGGALGVKIIDFITSLLTGRI